MVHTSSSPIVFKHRKGDQSSQISLLKWQPTLVLPSIAWDKTHATWAQSDWTYLRQCERSIRTLSCCQQADFWRSGAPAVSIPLPKDDMEFGKGFGGGTPMKLLLLHVYYCHRKPITWKEASDLSMSSHACECCRFGVNRSTADWLRTYFLMYFSPVFSELC